MREDVVVRTEDQALDWFVLRQGRYEPLAAGGDGLLRSDAFPGLWLDPAALLRGDLARFLAALAQGIASAEHAAFATSLRGP